MNNDPVYIGIDVAKHSLEVAPFYKGPSEVSNTVKGIQSLFRRVKSWDKPVILCCEATGGYEQVLITQAHADGIPIAMVNPRQVRDYARSKGILAKTDKLDARVLSEFGQQNQPRLLEPAAEWLGPLKALVNRRNDLVDTSRKEKSRLDPVPCRETVRSINRHLKWLVNEIDRIEKKLKILIENHCTLKARVDRLMEINSIGQTTAQSLLAGVPELGYLDDKKVTALVGLAPVCDDSGNRKGKRTTQGGRSEVRKALYMAALSAIKSNPIFREFYLKLKEKGKPSKVALTAVMRKQIILANRVLMDPEFKLS